MAKLKDISVQFISLVDKAANHREFIWKADDRMEGVVKIRKVDEEKRLVMGVVYTPDEMDSQGDWADADTIERAAHEFQRQLLLHNVDTQHDYKPDDGFVAESWIIRGEDPVFPDEKVGTWVVVIKVANDDTWEKVKAGELAGLSFAGTARKEQYSKQYESFSDMVQAETQMELPFMLANYIWELTVDAALMEDTDGLVERVAGAIREFNQLREAK